MQPFSRFMRLGFTDPGRLLSSKPGHTRERFDCFSAMNTATTYGSFDRRHFLALMASSAWLVITASPEPARALEVSEHPEPRPGIDAARVLARDSVPADVAPVFDQVREIPQVVDGIRCYCGCAEVPGMYSLLSCYEEAGMARYCDICQGEGKLAYELHKEGRSLKEIRAAIDRRFRDHY